jgi:hypothetical protein
MNVQKYFRKITPFETVACKRLGNARVPLTKCHGDYYFENDVI